MQHVWVELRLRGSGAQRFRVNNPTPEPPVRSSASTPGTSRPATGPSVSRRGGSRLDGCGVWRPPAGDDAGREARVPLLRRAHASWQSAGPPRFRSRPVLRPGTSPRRSSSPTLAASFWRPRPGSGSRSSSTSRGWSGRRSSATATPRSRRSARWCCPWWPGSAPACRSTPPTPWRSPSATSTPAPEAVEASDAGRKTEPDRGHASRIPVYEFTARLPIASQEVVWQSLFLAYSIRHPWFRSRPRKEIA